MSRRNIINVSASIRDRLLHRAREAKRLFKLASYLVLFCKSLANIE